MKPIRTLIAIAAIGALTLGNVRADTVHQSLGGEAARTSGGQDAVAAKLVETKDLPSGEKLTRLPGSTQQWGYVNYWFGLPSPAGAVTLRVKVYVDDTATGSYAFYIKRPAGDPLVKKLEIPADAPKNDFVTVDIPVEMTDEWNGLALKKIAASDKPSPWINTISVIK
ncbi:MAG: hypothetical protein BGO12_05165 [Verrucomicrobia bacterium 61-8]|nr:hypothetical protein [Verrucomicrobiota bacterium]OJU97735.1 MAG: hypothetical protein BGO12_05165 [Verrucomicrobia bacterium 61-8]